MQDHHLQLLEYLVFVKTSFGTLDLGSSQRKKRKPALPRQ
jgi:hypothetical protein